MTINSMGNGTMGTSPSNLPATIKDKAEGFADHVKGAMAAGQDKMIDVKDKVLDAKDVAVDKAGSVLSSVTSTIKHRPLLAVATAFGVGLLAMRIYRR